MYPLLRPLLFALTAEDAHAAAMMSLRLLGYAGPLLERVRERLAPPSELTVQTLGLDFPSPVGLAAGLDKNAHAPRALAALGFGFLELGTVTAVAQEPNPSPNMFRLPADRALVNRLGFPNEGAEAVAARYEREVGVGGAGVPVGFSIGKSRVVPPGDLDAVTEDYLTSFRAVRRVADFVVINISSPNTTGLRALEGTALARVLLGALEVERRAEGRPVPLLLKVSPDTGDAALDALMAVVADTGLDGVVATNTTTTRAGLRAPPEVVDAIGAGGLSGPPLRVRVCQIIPRVRAALGPDKTIIAVGGVGSALDAQRYLDLGANLVQLYTSFVFEGPGLPSRISHDLAELRRNAPTAG
jgi:dihydroorotate dehydrogenase